ncbi:protein CHROMATIN REMODELING 20 isoform X2 [Macadamia integrifolia]|uniref:protein CHROMATIN REMODELING 20 isoform X2 n=1 Tax=Macadamia integrifolia TaxID=60698 RepID=UPI001C4EA72C|nr:protein CHROMATIN REMODELING 20 isoform X2 [Macadamia integrifolia]
MSRARSSSESSGACFMACTMNGTEEQQEEVEDVASASSDSFTDNDLDEDELSSQHDEESHLEVPLTDEEIDEIIAEFLEVESKAAEAQESLEKESLAQVESEVRAELAQTLHGDDLEKAVTAEMRTFIEQWEAMLDELEIESAHLLEQLDGADVDLSMLYKAIESQAPNVCCTEAWKKRVHWAGSQVTSEINELMSDAEKYLQTHQPVRRKRGKLKEEGASGFLWKKIANENNVDAVPEDSDDEWESFYRTIKSRKASVSDDTSFGSKHWAAVYLAETPKEAASLGLKLPGVDEVEEIDDVEVNSSNPFYAAAIANEQEIVLSEEQKKNIRKIREEDDANIARKRLLHLKQRRRINISRQEIIQKDTSADKVLESNLVDCVPLNGSSQVVSRALGCGNGPVALNVDNSDTLQALKAEVLQSCASSNEQDQEKLMGDCNSTVLAEAVSPDLTETRGTKRLHDEIDCLDTETKKSRTVVIDSDDEVHMEDKSASHIRSEPDMETDSALEAKEEVDVDADSSPLRIPNGIEALEKFHCTACTKVVGAGDVRCHPLLKVIICESCKTILKEKMHEKDPDCSECYCGWCGRCNDLISCKSCKTLFCSTCIKRNFGEEKISESHDSAWLCCCCSPILLESLTLLCEKAIGAGGLIVSSSDSDSELSDADIGVQISTKKIRKKKIRRILDDAELGEETKRKIAIEKERQEHLKSLKVQFTAKSGSGITVNCNGNVPDGADAEILGDVINGYIANVVREKDEEAVRIPPSISSKLKPHQIAGIRFMWENIIQSVRKVKSGDKGLGCILAHTMGLGKTFQVIAFLYTAMRSVDLGLKTALIVTPVNVLHNWRREFVKWQPTELKPLRVFMLEDVPRERRAEWLAKWRAKGGVFLIGYSAFRNLSLGKNVKDRHAAREICYSLQDGPDILVCDEAHMIKNTRADTTQALKQVKCQRRIALTGSPLQNNLMEYYCMVDFVREGFLGSSHEFRNRFQNPIENGQHTNSTSVDVKIMNERSHILYEQLKGFVQRMDMNAVKKDLPPKTVFVIAVKLSPLQRKLYKRFLDVHGFTNDKVSGDKIRKRSFFAGYQALAQIWNHPGLLQMAKEHRGCLRQEDAVDNFLDDDSSSDDNIERDTIAGDKARSKNDFMDKKSDNGFFHEDWWSDLLHEKNYREADYSGKMVLLLEILSMSSEAGDKALVFSQSLTTLDLIEFYLSKLARKHEAGKYWKQGKDWYRLDGSTDGSERQKLVENFNEPKNTRVKCALISTRAGSLGINLHAANRVIIVDGSWNPTHDLQAIYRVWRYGQKKPVYAYRLMAHGTMEEKIYKRQVTKEGLAARVVDKQQIHRTMSKEEVLHLFDFGEDESFDSVREQGQENLSPSHQNSSGNVGISLKQKLAFPHGSCSSDKFMESLVSRHYPRWILNYHEHETLLQENEEEKLSKEEQDMAWETFRRTIEWEEVQRVSLDESTFERKVSIAKAGAPAPESIKSSEAMGSSRNRPVQRKCTNLSHLLTLRSQGTKVGCTTVCGECAQEICWETYGR